MLGCAVRVSDPLWDELADAPTLELLQLSFRQRDSGRSTKYDRSCHWADCKRGHLLLAEPQLSVNLARGCAG